MADAMTSASLHRAYAYMGAWGGCHLIGLFFEQQAVWNCAATSIKAETALNATIHSKMLNLTAEERVMFQEGDLMTLFIVDTKYACGFLRTFYILFSEPAIIITAQVFLIVQIGAYALIMTAVTIVALIVLFLLSRWTAQIELDKLDYFHRRTVLNIELLQGMKALKQLGWERLLRSRNKELRIK